MILRTLAAFLLFPLAGCFCHRTCALRPEVIEPCRAAPCECRNQVYVVLLHGFDPCDVGELATLRDTLNSVGFNRTYYGQWYHIGDFAEDIVRRREREPGARVVIVSSGLGLAAAHQMAERLADSDVEVVSLIGIDAPSWATLAYTAPTNVGNVRYLRKKSPWALGADPVDAFDVEATNWTGLAGQPEVAQAVLDELTAVANAMPYSPKPLPQLSFADPAPTPQRVVAKRGRSDAWDFLQPTAKLTSPGSGITNQWTALKPKDDGQ